MDIIQILKHPSSLFNQACPALEHHCFECNQSQSLYLSITCGFLSQKSPIDIFNMSLLFLQSEGHAGLCQSILFDLLSYTHLLFENRVSYQHIIFNTLGGCRCNRSLFMVTDNSSKWNIVHKTIFVALSMGLCNLTFTDWHCSINLDRDILLPLLLFATIFKIIQLKLLLSFLYLMYYDSCIVNKPIRVVVTNETEKNK